MNERGGPYLEEHHVIHRRRPRRLAIALKAASHRHVRHHSVGIGNFRVTTPNWDYVFGTNILSGTRVKDIALGNMKLSE